MTNKTNRIDVLGKLQAMAFWHGDRWEKVHDAVSELIEAARLVEFHFAQFDEARLAGEKAHLLKYLRVEIESLRAALSRAKGEQA